MGLLENKPATLQAELCLNMYSAQGKTSSRSSWNSTMGLLENKPANLQGRALFETAQHVHKAEQAPSLSQNSTMGLFENKPANLQAELFF